MALEPGLYLGDGKLYLQAEPGGLAVLVEPGVGTWAGEVWGKGEGAVVKMLDGEKRTVQDLHSLGEHRPYAGAEVVLE